MYNNIWHLIAHKSWYTIKVNQTKPNQPSFLLVSYYLSRSLLSYHSFLQRGSLKKFPDFFRMGTFIDSTHMKL